VQVDVKVVTIGGRKVFQYTALDDCTRFWALRLYRRQNHWANLDFLGAVQRALPLPIRKLHSHRIDHEEFSSGHTFADFESAMPALAAWEHHYNYERFSLALQGHTPAETLELRLPLAQSA
jgi:hypothetical protein